MELGRLVLDEPSSAVRPDFHQKSLFLQRCRLRSYNINKIQGIMRRTYKSFGQIYVYSLIEFGV